MSNDSLKPWENKKGQTFVVMFVFYMSFFAAGSWLKLKKKTCKKRGSQQKFGPSWFARALQQNPLSQIYYSRTFMVIKDQ